MITSGDWYRDERANISSSSDTPDRIQLQNQRSSSRPGSRAGRGDGGGMVRSRSKGSNVGGMKSSMSAAPLNRSQSCMDSLPNHMSDGRVDRSSWVPPDDQRERPDRSKTPDQNTHHRRDSRAKTPDRAKDRTRTPDRSRKKGTSPERGDRRGRSRSPEDMPGRHGGMDSRSSKPPKPDSRSRPPDSHSLDGRDLESIYLDSRPLKQLSHPLENNHEEDEVGELPAEAETSLNGEKVPKEGIESVPNKQRGEAGPGSVTSKPPRDGGTRGGGGGGSKEYARQHMRQNGPLGDDVYQNSSERYEDERPVRTRAYSDSEAENYLEPPNYRFVEFSHPSPARIKHSKSDRSSRKAGPPNHHGSHQSETMPDRYYKIPYRIPYYTRPPENNADYDYDNAVNSVKPSRNGSLQVPTHPRGGSKNSRNSFRPYPAPYAPHPPYCAYQSETTENDYYTPTDPVVAPSGKKSKHKRSHSDSSSSRTLTSPWNNDCNKIITPKFPLQSARDGTPLGSIDQTLGNSSKYLHKLKCTPSANNVWHDPLLGQDKTDIVYSGDNDSLKSEKDSPMEPFADFSGDVTLNYLRFIWNSPEIIRKIIWGSLFIGFFVYSFYCCWRSFATYLDKPTATKYNMYFEPNKILTFPTITICNMNPHNASYLDRPENRPMKAYLYEKENKKLKWLLGKIKSDESESKNFNVKNYYRNSGQKLEDFIEDVKFKEEPLDVKLAFQEKFTTHGLCWTFNVDGSKTVNRTGMEFGLSLSLNINQDIYPKFVTKAGVKIMFHNKYEPALIDEYGMALTPGTESFISLSHERNKNLKAPTNGCREKGLPLYDTYSVSGCERQCFTDIMIEECGCRSYYLRGNTEECRLYKESTCVKEVVERYHNGAFSGREGCQCPDPCTSASYLATLSTAEYPAKNYGEALQRWNKQNSSSDDEAPRDVQYYRENFLKLHIYFEILSIKEVEKVYSYQWSNLMGDVGGQLGLFLGANVVTIFEFVDFLARLFWYNCIMRLVLYYSNSKKKKNNNNHRP